MDEEEVKPPESEQESHGAMTVFKGSLYFLIAAMGPIVLLLESDKSLTERLWVAASVSGIYQGLVALKAFTSRGPNQ